MKTMDTNGVNRQADDQRTNSESDEHCAGVVDMFMSPDRACAPPYDTIPQNDLLILFRAARGYGDKDRMTIRVGSLRAR